MKCNLCGREIEGYGNNPAPLIQIDDDRCCDLCDSMYVIPARIAQLTEHFTEEEWATITREIRAENGLERR